MSRPRYLCIHGHFYQPPRENPWLDVVEVQESANPDHDWNERITRECYAPNARARIVNRDGRIVHLVNNYAGISFNFGPTLLSWMADHAPQVHRGIVEADRLSRQRRGGHGNALAQVYNHMILPLADERDKRTQVLWGIADFRHRFGREPEGMWLAETAVDTASLEALADAGIRFTILAPHQARRWRRIGAEEWDGATGGIDPSRAYLARLPSGRSIALFFYDGNISRQVAFERLLESGERFLGRLLQGFDEDRDHAQLMHIATDGESYGHHHAHGDMALADVLNRLGRDPGIRLTNYGEFLELHPPEWEVEIHEATAWSCAHGVGRWNSDCGCRTRGDWHQRWREPLRRSLDGLKLRLDRLFAARGRDCFPDPWAARDAYIEVILDRDRGPARDFLLRHGHPDLDDDQSREALGLLEMQRCGMLMFTSCGWFFDEISGLEPTQCLHYAARAIHLAGRFGLSLEKGFVRGLIAAPSNLPRYRDGRGVWEQSIRPATVDLERVLAHTAIGLIFPAREAAGSATAPAFEVEVLEREVRARGGSHLAVGRLSAHSRQTWDEAEMAFVVLHYGGLDFHAVLRPPPSPREFAGLKRRLLESYRADSLAEVTALVAREFPGRVHHLDDLFADEQRRIIGIVLEDRVEEYRRTFEQLVRRDDDLLDQLGRLHHPTPDPLRAAASSYLDDRLRDELRRLEEDGDLEPIRALAERGRAWGARPGGEPLARELTEGLRRAVGGLGPSADLPGLVARAARLLDAASLLGIEADLWEVQNQLLDAYAGLAETGVLDGPLLGAFAELADRLKIGRGLLGWRP